MNAMKKLTLAVGATFGLALGGIVGTSDVAYAEGEELVGGVIIAWQKVDTTDPSGTDEFEYCLETTTPGAPMPEGADGQKYCFTMKGNATNPMQLSAGDSIPDVSEYTLRPVTPLPDGYTMDPVDGYTYKVYTHRQGADYVVLAFNSGENSEVLFKEEDPDFTVTYKATPTTPPVTTPPTTKPPATKPPTNDLVETGAPVAFGAMLVLLLAGGILLLRRRDAE